MKKVFLYLYPIKEFTEIFLFHDDSLYDELGVERPLPILNACIDKRYRQKGYQIIFALYPDKKLYGIDKKENDKIIYTDIPFSEASAIDENGNVKKDFVPKYPNELFLLQQIGPIDELVIGGYHVQSCVKRVGKVALKNGINTLVDLDLTDLFFSLYKHKDYFCEENYSKESFRMHMIGEDEEDFEFNERFFNKEYESPIYGFINEPGKTK